MKIEKGKRRRKRKESKDQSYTTPNIYQPGTENLLDALAWAASWTAISIPGPQGCLGCRILPKKDK